MHWGAVYNGEGEVRMYDLDEVKRVVEEKRGAFYKKIAWVAFFMISVAIVVAVDFSEPSLFSAFVAETVLFFVARKIYLKSGAGILLSGEIKGKNIKEYEYGIQKEARPRIFRMTNLPHTYANNVSAPLRLNGTVYLELENGQIKEISGLFKAHIDIYEEGDVLLKCAGTKYPVVISRRADRQPCPICGEVNDMSSNACRSCGLGITSRPLR